LDKREDKYWLMSNKILELKKINGFVILRESSDTADMKWINKSVAHV
jgi:hypothetical protein